MGRSSMQTVPTHCRPSKTKTVFSINNLREIQTPSCFHTAETNTNRTRVLYKNFIGGG